MGVKELVEWVRDLEEKGDLLVSGFEIDGEWWVAYGREVEGFMNVDNDIVDMNGKLADKILRLLEKFNVKEKILVMNKCAKEIGMDNFSIGLVEREKEYDVNYGKVMINRDIVKFEIFLELNNL